MIKTPLHLSSVCCSWDSVFLTYREKFNTQTENTTPEEYLGDLYRNADSSHWQGPDGGDHDSITQTVRRFMATRTGAGNGPASFQQTAITAGFCSNQQSGLPLLKDGEKVDDMRVAMVYEWENKPSRGARQRRAYPSPLTHQELLVKLCEPRFVTPTHGPTLDGKETADADRRIIYINNLDPLIMSILAKTTSRLETPIIQRTIFHHLTARTSFQIHIATKGFKTFSMELGISYFRLRKEEGATGLNRFDTRQRWDKTGPLRATLFSPTNRTEDTPFINNSFRIYETHLSVAVTGVDHYRWTAWGVSDESWFEPSDTMSRYYHGPESGSQPDPLSAAELDVTPPEPDPRHYFLRIFEIRIGMVAREWESILYTLQQDVHRVGSNPLFSFPEQSFESRDGREKVRRLADWNNEMTTLVETLLNSLSQTLAAWEVFQRTDIGYFIDNEIGSDVRRPPLSSPLHQRPSRPKAPDQSKISLISTLHIIEKTFLNLHLTRGEMERLKDILENQRRSLIKGEKNYSIFLQQRTGEVLKELTWVVIVWSPVLITAGLCSTQTGMLPFKNNIWDFIDTFLVISILFVLIILILRYRKRLTLADWRILPSTSTSLAALAVGNTPSCSRTTSMINTSTQYEDLARPNSQRVLSFSRTCAFLESSKQWIFSSRIFSGPPHKPPGTPDEPHHVV